MKRFILRSVPVFALGIFLLFPAANGEEPVPVDPLFPAFMPVEGVAGNIKGVGSGTMNNLMALAVVPFGLDRRFMHLGFHVYDVGFQSQNSEAARPMVYTTTLLLILIIVALDLAAVLLRARLRRGFTTERF